jgi:hypothetical protein
MTLIYQADTTHVCKGVQQGKGRFWGRFGSIRRHPEPASAFLAVKALAAITGLKEDKYLPAYAEFDKDPAPCISVWKAWWTAEGKQKYASSAPIKPQR